MEKTIKERVSTIKTKVDEWWDDNKGKVFAGGVLAASAVVPFVVGYFTGKRNGDITDEQLKDHLMNHQAGLIRTDHSIVVQMRGVHDDPIGYYEWENDSE